MLGRSMNVSRTKHSVAIKNVKNGIRTFCSLPTISPASSSSTSINKFTSKYGMPITFSNSLRVEKKNRNMLLLRNMCNSRILLSPTVTSVPMPSLSPTQTHGTISVWLKKPGDDMHAGDVLCDIETDKASVGFEIQEDSVLAKILVEAQGPELLCGEPICLTVEDQEAYKEFLLMDSAASTASAEPTATAAATSSASKEQISNIALNVIKSLDYNDSSNSSSVLKLSPAARHLLQSNAIDPKGIKGTSKNGIISKSDVVSAMKAGTAVVGSLGKEKTAHNAQTHTAPAPSTLATVAPTPTPTPLPVFKEILHNIPPVNENYTDIPNSKMRKIIASRLSESKSQVPHFYTSIECDIDDLLLLRKSLKKDMDINISVNDLVIRSAALALKDVPEANAKWNNKTNQIDSSSIVDISVAVATPNGLITPIVKGADRIGLYEINSRVKDLAARAKDGKLKPEEFQGGSFSVSNLGMFGISSFTAVINPPQACILAVGAGIARVLPPKKMGGKPRIVTTVTVQLSGDRRVVDESLASQFLQIFSSYLSNPKSMML